MKDANNKLNDKTYSQSLLRLAFKSFPWWYSVEPLLNCDFPAFFRNVSDEYEIEAEGRCKSKTVIDSVNSQCHYRDLDKLLMKLSIYGLVEKAKYWELDMASLKAIITTGSGAWFELTWMLEFCFLLQFVYLISANVGPSCTKKKFMFPVSKRAPFFSLKTRQQSYYSLVLLKMTV